MSTSIQRILQQLQDQVNSGPSLASLNDSQRKLPQGMTSGDLIFDSSNGELRIGIYNGVSVLYASLGSFTGAITDLQHGTRGGGNLHPIATTLVAGFMSAGDKIKADAYRGDTSSVTAPSATEYPTSGDWGFHKDTALNVFYVAHNFAGTVKSVVMT